MADTKDLIVKLSLENAKFKAEVAESRKKMGKLSDTAEKQNKTLSKLKGGFIALGAVLAGAVVLGFTKALKAASNFEEANQKFGVTFRGVSKEANAMRQDLVKNYNMSSSAATTLLANTGDLLSGFGFTGEAALDLAGKTNKLAADLASFANVPVAQASEAITKGLLGERESMKQLGIAILDADVKQRLLEKGQNKLTGGALRQAKAQATLELAMEQSKNAIGDVARSSDSTANIMKRFQNVAEDLQVVVGQKLLKFIKPLIVELDKFIKSAEGMKTIDTAIKGMVTGFIMLKTTAVVTFNSIKAQVQTVVEGFTTLKDFWSNLFAGDVKKAFKSIGDGVGDIFKNVKDSAGNIGGAYKDAFVQIKDLWEQTASAQIEGMNDVVVANDVANAAVIESDKRTAEERKKIAQSAAKLAVSTYKDLVSSISNLNDARTEKEVSAAEERTQATIEQFGEESDQAIAAKALEEAEIKKIKNAAAIKNKKASVAQAALNIPIAVASAFATTPGGPITKGIAAAAAGVTAGINLAAVKAAPVPTFAQGGIINEVANSLQTPAGEDGLIAVQRGEAVLNQSAVTELGEGTINALNGLGTTNNTNNFNVADSKGALDTFNEFAKTQGGSRGAGI
jgi:hypothetical protein